MFARSLKEGYLWILGLNCKICRVNETINEHTMNDTVNEQSMSDQTMRRLDLASAGFQNYTLSAKKLRF